MNARSIVGFMDAPQVLDASVTNIPGNGSSPVQVVASMPNISLHVHFYDGMGQYVGIYRGAAGKESLVCIVGGGGSDQKPCNLSPGDRVSLRSMDASAITSGSLCLQFSI